MADPKLKHEKKKEKKKKKNDNNTENPQKKYENFDSTKEESREV